MEEQARSSKGMSSLVKRLIFSTLFISLSLFAIFYAPDWFFVLVVEAFCLSAVYEFLKMSEKSGLKVNIVLGLLFAFLIPISLYFKADSVVLASACLVIFGSHVHPRYRPHALLGTAVTLLGLVYVAWFFSHIVKIKNLEHGPAWVFYSILLVKGGDAGAYFVGGRYGRHKLIESISPNKTVEGSIGCFATTIALSLLSKIFLPHVPFLHLFLLGAILGILSQLGDLAESLIKRNVGIKDSGAIPGLGGILDILDSLLLTLPFVYYYIIAFPSI
ncbi:MAG: phosphatidate cytidylyltransferase [Candidatus Omnitrophica bacterium]|nr:phosphatidate cytidylyltransferase [Candidatus Omnitrophota bacterium]